MSTAANPFITMNTPQFKMESVHYVPWYNSKRNSVIFATRYNDNYCKPGIYELDLKSNKITFLTQYMSNAFTGTSNHVYMSDDKTVSIIDDFQSDKEEIKITKFNLSTNTMTYEPIKILDDQTTNLLRYIRLSFIPSNNTLHLFCTIDDAQNSYRYHPKHVVFDTKQNSVIKIISYNMLSSPYCIYIKSKKQLLGVTSKCIWSLFDNENEWKHYKDLPLATSYLTGFHVASYDNDIIFLFDKKSKEIWCFSIMFNRWFRSQHILPETLAKTVYGIWPIKDNSNWIHFISLKDYKQQFHIKASLKQLLPKEMIQCYKKYYNLLIMGYARNIEPNQSVQTLPMGLKLLILNYYQLFS